MLFQTTIEFGIMKKNHASALTVKFLKFNYVTDFFGTSSMCTVDYICNNEFLFFYSMAEDNETNDHEMPEEKNGDAMETDSKSKELADYGLNESVVTKLEELFTTGSALI